MNDNSNPLEENNQSSAPSEGVSPEGQPKGRTAEDRINELLSKNKEIEEELKSRPTREEFESLKVKFETVPTPPPVTPEETNPDVDKAMKFVKEKGKFVSKDELDHEMQSVKDQMYLDSKHQQLENAFDGSDGRPKYDRAKVNDYMRSHPVYDPEIAYSQIYKDELFDWQLKKLESDRKKKPYVARPSSTSGIEADNQSITREKLQEVYKNPTPENRMWYEQNRDKIRRLMAEQKL